jgi:hypothetical protein
MSSIKNSDHSSEQKSQVEEDSDEIVSDEPTLKELSPYLKQVFLIKRSELMNRGKDKVLKSKEFTTFPKNSQQSMEKLADDFKTEAEELVEAVKYLESLETAEKPKEFLKKTRKPKLITKIEVLPSYHHLVLDVKKNNSSAHFWKTWSYRLRKVFDAIELLENNYKAKFAPLDILVGIVKIPTILGIRVTDVMIKRHDPTHPGPGFLRALTSFETISAISSAIALIALAAGGTAVGVAIAPICLFVYAGANGADKLVDLYNSCKSLYKEFKRKNPRNTYWLRVGKKASEVVYNLANTAFKIVLATVAFIAIANPLGLVIGAPLLATIAGVVSGISGGGLWAKTKLEEMIKEIDNKELLKEARKAKKLKQPKPELDLAQRGPKPEQQQVLLPGYQTVARPQSRLVWSRDGLTLTAVKTGLEEASREFQRQFTLVPDPNDRRRMAILRPTPMGPGAGSAAVPSAGPGAKLGTEPITAPHSPTREVATVLHHHDFTKYKLAPLASNSASERAAHQQDLQALLRSIQKNKAQTLTLKGGTSREILLTFETALNMGITRINIDPITRERVSRLHGRELQALERRHLELIRAEARGARPPASRQIKPKESEGEETPPRPSSRPTAPKPPRPGTPKTKT